MCIYKRKDPMSSPTPPDKGKAALSAANEARANLAGRSSGAANILTSLTDEEVAASARQRQLTGLPVSDPETMNPLRRDTRGVRRPALR